MDIDKLAVQTACPLDRVQVIALVIPLDQLPHLILNEVA
ncbi:hypothetical protein DB29_02708 [Shouchella clausii]|nr:hypothetical protein DB29_02708 [Shouchella clausii]